ncbi:MAG: VCBS repeat-containing protein, partial [Candidatus Omnitrophica bacterium]|nr:VCBS repeat-containing protein [Candidatus Omnitrophota bacterium]
MEKWLRKIICITLAAVHLLTFCLRDVCFAKEQVSKESKSSVPSSHSQETNSSSTTPSQSTQEEAPRPAAKVASAAPAGNISTPSSSFNLGVLQSFQTEPSTGRATFSVPIAVPPGRSGMQPNIALAYASGNGNGFLGVGWSLELGSIERSTKKGIPKYDSSDTFIFNSGGSNAELVHIGDGQYRAKVEEAFLTFTFDGTYWLVKDKSGTTYQFGSTTTSRQRNFRWALDRVWDIRGNYLNIDYITDQDQLYPNTITYGGNTPSSFGHPYRVEFIWDSSPRLDTIYNGRPGFLVTTTKRLNNIVIRYQSELVRRYHLTYAASSSQRSLLTTITQYGRDDTTSLPPVTFTYNSATPGWQTATNYTFPTAAYFNAGSVFVDVNNDLFPDIIRRQYNGNGETNHSFLFNPFSLRWEETGTWRPNRVIWSYSGDQGLRFGDVNGDSWIDYVAWINVTPKEVYINNKVNGWDNNSNWQLPDDYAISNHWADSGGAHSEPQGTAVLDIDGDCYSDYIVCRTDKHSIYINNKDGKWEHKSNWDMSEGNLLSDTQFADLTGDGLPDLIVATAVYLNTGSGWQRQS